MKINKYPDGTSYVNNTKLGKQIFRINSYEDLWHLNQFVDAFRNEFDISKPTIVIPNLIDAQADRRFNKGESNGLKLVCEFLNNMKANFEIFHPHNPEVVEALMNNVEIIDNNNFISNVIFKINGGNFNQNFILMSSDSGGFKPLMKLCNKIGWQGETFSANKSRSYKNNKSILTQEIYKDDFKKKDILIIDDICVYGGTFKGLSKLLKERNCGKLYLAVSHMTVQNLGQDPITNYFDKVFTTNSKFDEYFCSSEETPSFNDEQPENLEIIKIFEI